MPIPRQSAFEDHKFELLRAFRTGASIELAAEQSGVAVNTLRRWLTNGRNHPEGMYGKFSQEVDKIREGKMDLIWLARDFTDALRAVQKLGDEAGPQLQRVYDRVSGLPSGERGKFEVQLARHLMVAVLMIFPKEILDQMNGNPDACFEGFWEMVDDFYAARAKVPG